MLVEGSWEYQINSYAVVAKSRCVMTDTSWASASALVFLGSFGGRIFLKHHTAKARQGIRPRTTHV